MTDRILNVKELTSHGNIKGRKYMAEIMEEALKAADPYFNTKKLVKIEDGKLIFDGPDFEAADDPRRGTTVFELDKLDRIYVFAIGKGIQRIAKALEEILGDYLTGGHVLTKHGDEMIMEKLEMTCGGHPIPDKFCVEGCKKIVKKIEDAKLTERDLVITVVGNGVSSLCTYPADGVSLEDVMETTRLMQIEYGVPTSDLNQIRTSVDKLKGGRITRLLKPARMVHLLGVPITINTRGVSSYEGLLKNNLWLHSLCDATSAKEALAVIRRWDTKGKTPKSIVEYLENYDPEKAVMSYEEFSQIDCRIFGLMPEHIDAITVGMKKAEELGFNAYLLTRNHQCESSQAGKLYGSIAMFSAKEDGAFKRPCAIFSAGELIVTCGDDPGIGGRNQEFCVSAAVAIKGSDKIVISSADTDGTDGPGGDFHPDATAKGITNLAGGIVDGYTFAEAVEKGVDLQKALETHGTSNPLWELDCGIAATHNISINDITCMLILE